MEKSLKQVTNNLQDSKDNLKSAVRVGTIVRREFMDLVDREINKVWKDGKKKNENEAYQLEKKHIIKEPDSDVYSGVFISGKKLDDIEIELLKDIEREKMTTQPSMLELKKK